MNTEHTRSKQLPTFVDNAFLRGFLLRLLYGSFALPILALIAPSLFGEQLHILPGTLACYLAICVAGGVHDTAHGIRRGFQMPRRVDLLIICISVTSLIILLLRRPS
jgi:hypothetical protein